MPSNHSLISPSSFARTLACPASLLGNLWGPYTSSAAADAGTSLHAAAESCFDFMAVHGFLPDSMAPEIAFYVQHCAELMAGAIDYEVEGRADFSHLVYGKIDAFGTVDFWAYDGKVLHIVDLKTGQVPVDPANNPQLSLYAIGVSQRLAERYPDCEFEEIRLCIAQGGQILMECIDLHALLEREREYSLAMRVALSPNAPFSESVGKHCTWCKNKVSCPTQARSLKSALGLHAEALDKPTDQALPDLVGVMRLAKFAADIAEDCKSKLQAHFDETGELPDGLKTKKYSPPRKWQDGRKAALEIAGRLGWRESIDEGLLVPASPTQTVKVLDGLEDFVQQSDAKLLVGLAD